MTMVGTVAQSTVVALQSFEDLLNGTVFILHSLRLTRGMIG